MKRLVGAILSMALALSAFVGIAYAAQDCDNNAVVYCGAQTQAELQQKIATGDGKNGDIRQIYTQYGISTSQIDRTVNGTVTKDGKVIVNGQTVATGAQSVGRQFIPGSTQQGTVYIRPTSVSFKQDSLEAFVYMPNGTFAWAILKSCGNPVVANAVPKPVTPTVKPTPPPPAPQPAPTPTPTPPAIPQTGSTQMLAVLGAMVTGYTTRAWIRGRWRLRRSMLQN